MKLIFRTFLIYLLVASTKTFAEPCFSEEQLGKFTDDIYLRAQASKMNPLNLYRFVGDRFGYGLHSGAGDFTSNEKSDPEILAQAVVERLRDINKVRSGIDKFLSEEAFPFAASDSTEIISTLQQQRRFIKKISDQIKQETDPNEKARLENERLQARMDLNSVVRNLQDTVAARFLGEALAGPNYDVGAVIGQFWFNHFNVYTKSVPDFAVSYQNELKKMSCASFYDLLLASAKHPAMLTYLDNRRSVKGSINENYGRELLELHTFGDDQFRFYEHSDIVAAANILTGWGVVIKRDPEVDADHPRSDQVSFQFYPSQHEPKKETLFAGASLELSRPLTLPVAASDENGEATAAAVGRGEKLLQHLAAHPATRHNICRKIFLFLTGRVSKEAVSGCASPDVWGDKGNLPRIYHYVLTHDLMWSPDAVYIRAAQGRDKTPLELIATTLRAVDFPKSRIKDHSFLKRQLQDISGLGLNLAQIAPPTGYTAHPWVNAGMLIGWQQYLFSEADSSSLTVAIDEENYSGDELETVVNQLLNEETPDKKEATYQRIVYATRKALAIPGIGQEVERAAYIFDDRLGDRKNNQIHNLRSLTHGQFTKPLWLRK